MNTDKLWRKFLKYGDDHSFSILYNSHIDKLYSYGIHLGFQNETCKDAIQDVFFKLYASRENLTQVNNIAAYLFKSLKNRLIDIVRKDTKAQTVELIDQPFSIDITILDNIIDAENAALLKSKVEELLKNLTAQQREAVYLRYMHELSYDEISELLNINPESARKLMFRAMRSLREQTNSHHSKAQILLILPLIKIL
ncbi:MAG: RNA polymerase sigma factor [Bacteroidales bacterium]|jgi:RNA polymerase sigma factor (sigma-70 family)|nr:RNA polymerase sigma factor [Bacteroidales bacterium]